MPFLRSCFAARRSVCPVAFPARRPFVQCSARPRKRKSTGFALFSAAVSAAGAGCYIFEIFNGSSTGFHSSATAIRDSESCKLFHFNARLAFRTPIRVWHLSCNRCRQQSISLFLEIASVRCKGAVLRSWLLWVLSLTTLPCEVGQPQLRP